MIEGRCICGGVTVELPRAPEYLNACNCRLCQRSGGIWGYFPRDEVTIRGETRRFVRSDLDEAYLANLFCPTCGNAAAWIALDSEYPRMGVNMRLFEPDALRGIETMRANFTQTDRNGQTVKGTMTLKRPDVPILCTRPW